MNQKRQREAHQKRKKRKQRSLSKVSKEFKTRQNYRERKFARALQEMKQQSKSIIPSTHAKSTVTSSVSLPYLEPMKPSPKVETTIDLSMPPIISRVSKYAAMSKSRSENLLPQLGGSAHHQHMMRSKQGKSVPKFVPWASADTHRNHKEAEYVQSSKLQLYIHFLTLYLDVNDRCIRIS